MQAETKAILNAITNNQKLAKKLQRIQREIKELETKKNKKEESLKKVVEEFNNNLKIQK